MSDLLIGYAVLLVTYVPGSILGILKSMQLFNLNQVG